MSVWAVAVSTHGFAIAMGFYLGYLVAVGLSRSGRREIAFGQRVRVLDDVRRVAEKCGELDADVFMGLVHARLVEADHRPTP